MAVWTPVIVVSRSATICEIDTFMTLLSSTITNCAEAKIAIGRPRPRRGKAALLSIADESGLDTRSVANHARRPAERGGAGRVVSRRRVGDAPQRFPAPVLL